MENLQQTTPLERMKKMVDEAKRRQTLENMWVAGMMWRAKKEHKEPEPGKPVNEERLSIKQKEKVYRDQYKAAVKQFGLPEDWKPSSGQPSEDGAKSEAGVTEDFPESWPNRHNIPAKERRLHVSLQISPNPEWTFEKPDLKEKTTTILRELMDSRYAELFSDDDMERIMEDIVTVQFCDVLQDLGQFYERARQGLKWAKMTMDQAALSSDNASPQTSPRHSEMSDRDSTGNGGSGTENSENGNPSDTEPELETPTAEPMP